MLDRESTIQPGLFRLPDDPVASMILIPGFRSAKCVRGAFGWFTAGWVARLAPGLAEYLSRNSTLPIDFTIAPALFPNERTAMEQAITMTAQEAAERIADVFVNGRLEASALGRHALDCLAWMIAAERLRLRIAIPKPESSYHPKIWLFEDGVNQVVARGSGNATYHGVAGGVEHIDVDVSWLPESKVRVTNGVSMLNDWSQGNSLGIEEVIELPEALAKDIIQTAPVRSPIPEDYAMAASGISTSGGSGINHWISRSKNRLRIPAELEWTKGKYSHQREAVESWENSEPSERGVIAMATGAGKTLTALICATRSQDRLCSEPFLVVVSAPSIPLILQWREVVKKFGVTSVTPTLETNTNSALTRVFRALRSGGTHVMIVTNNLLCDPSFQKTVAEKILVRNRTVETMLIADEAHTLGVTSFIRNKPTFFNKRLALSATPVRQYDPDGTEEVFDFFGPPIFNFEIDRAIGLCLVPYDYYVHACTLKEDELDEFERLTQRIGFASATKETNEDSTLERLQIARRRIIETGKSKVELLHNVLVHRGPKSLHHALIYATAKDPEQFSIIGKLLNDLQIKWASVTQHTTANQRQLSGILESFANGSCQVLLAKKVLDEGVDIPSVREAFIIASSTVEREWIQRRGRVLRTHPNKQFAIVHDFLALPPADIVRRDGARSLKKVVETELNRTYAFGSFARNFAGNKGVHADLDRIKSAYWSADKNNMGILLASGKPLIASSTPKEQLW